MVACPCTRPARPFGCQLHGDLQLRFVFRTPGMPDSALTADALTALDLNVQRAPGYCVSNFKRSNGTPIPAEFSKGIYVLRGIDAEHVANYLLDRVFWRKLLERFPSGVVVAVPKRGILYFADAGTPESVEELTRLAAKLLHTAGTATLSRQLYAFGDKGWRVHGPLPAPLTPDPVPVSARRLGPPCAMRLLLNSMPMMTRRAWNWLPRARRW